MKEINVKTVETKDFKRDYKKTIIKQENLNTEEIETLEAILGYNDYLWKIAATKGIDKNSIKEETINSNFENEHSNYIGKMSGDLIVTKKGSVVIGYPGELYYNEYQKYISTAGFW